MSYPQEPIAIIGSGCRFPGSANTSHKLWELLCRPRDLSREVPASRFNARAFYHDDGEHHGATNVTKAYFLDEDPRLFDAAFFNIAPREAEAMDPQQRLLLETVYEAIDDAGLTLASLRGSQTGCYVGVMTGDYAETVTRDPETFSQYMATGTSRGLIANRVSYAFDLRGPSMTVDTACSSSLVAVHLAVQSLRSGESAVACAAGCNLVLNADSFIAETSLHMLSPEGHSRMWDARANGYARGEGVAAVMLKTLSRALRDGDRIDAVIRETGVSQDGRTQGITLPSPEAQSALIRATYRRAGLDALKASDRCQYFEAHGTGTPAGDPREASAIHDAFFRDGQAPRNGQKLLVGSIKTIVGHTEGCAGVAGLLKAALALKNKKIPPNQHFDTLNPSVAPSYTHLCVPTSLMPWPKAPEEGGVLRASVNSFGFGGTNSHAILENYVPEVHGLGPSARDVEALLPTASGSSKGSLPAAHEQDRNFTPLPLVLSANSPSALLAMADSHLDMLSAGTVPLHDLAATMLARRSALPFRITFAGPTRAQLIQDMGDALDRGRAAGKLGARADAARRPGSSGLLGIFTGQGAQWPAMGSSLLRHCPGFRETLAALDDALQSLPDGPPWLLADELAALPGRSRVSEAAVSQPACTALQLGLVNLLGAAGISFHTVVGHSSGEIAAAYAAGFLSATDAIRIAYYRGRHAGLAAGRQGQKGSMMAVGWGLDEAASFVAATPQLHGRLAVAASNSPGSVTLSGDDDAVHAAKQLLDSQGVFNRVLLVDTAYHSHHMDPCAGPYLESLKACGITVNRGDQRCTWISSVHDGVEMTPERAASALAGPYWRDNMVQTVLFSQAVEAALRSNGGPFAFGLEVGPHPALKGPALQTIKAQLGDDMPYHGVLDRKRDDAAACATALSALALTLGPRSVDFDGYSRSFAPHRGPCPPLEGLPTYPWDHRLLWRESRINRQMRTRREPPHELLGVRTPDDSEHEPRWRNVLKTDEIPWLKHHRIQGQTVVPGAAYCAMALEAAASLARGRGEAVRSIELHGLDIVKAISIDDASEGTETLFALKVTASANGKPVDADFSLSASALENGTMRRICGGRLRVHTDSGAADTPLPVRGGTSGGERLEMNIDRFYSALGDVGLGYSGPFRSLSYLERVMDQATGVVAVPEACRSLPVHPAWLDVSFQTVFAAFAATKDDSLWTAFVPVKVGCLRFFPGSRAAEQPQGDLGYVVDAAVSSFDAASTESLPTITSDLSIYDAGTGQRRMEIHDLIMSALVPATAADDRHVYQKTVWEQDVITGLDVEAPIHVDQAEAASIAACESAATAYLEAAQASRSARHPVLATMQQGQQDDSVDWRLVHAIGHRLLNGLSPANKQHCSDPSHHLQPLISQWQSERLGSSRILSHLLRAVSQIAHRYPRMNILQLGASERVTQRVIEELQARFLTYTVAVLDQDSVQDVMVKVNSGIMAPAFATIESLLSDDRVLGGFDLVLATEPLKALQNMSTARQLLRPGGFLLVVAPTGDSSRLSLIRSSQAAIAGSEGDKSAALTPATMHAALKKSAFSGIMSMALDVAGEDKHTTSLIASQATDDAVSVLCQPLLPTALSSRLLHGKLLILSGTSLKTVKLAEAVRSRLLSVWQGEIRTLETVVDAAAESLADVRAVLSLTELDTPLFKALDNKTFSALQALFQKVRTMVHVTNQSGPSGPYQSALLGLGRTITAENAEISLQFLDLDAVEGPETVVSESLLRLVAAQELQNQGALSRLLWSTELELRVRNGRLCIPRVVMDKARNDSVNSLRRVVSVDASTAAGPVALELCADSYVARQVPRAATQGSTPTLVNVRVSMCCAEPALVSEHATPLYLSIGTTRDQRHVLALGTQNASHLQVPKDLVLHLHTSVRCTEEEDTAQLLGQAQYHVQAKVLSALLPKAARVLVFEPDKAFEAFLDEALTVASKDSVWFVRFAHGTAPGRNGRSITIPRGVSMRDIKRLLPTNLGIITHPKRLGHDADENLGTLRRCVPNSCAVVSFSQLQSLVTSDSAITGRQALEYLAIMNASRPNPAEGSIAVVKAEHLAQQGGQQLRTGGQTMVSWSGEQRLLTQATPISPASLFSSDKSYLLVGMAGQMGQSICQWMVRSGARHLAVSSRNPSQNGAWIEELEHLGASVRVITADVTRREDVTRLRDDMSKHMPPVAGIVQGAMVLADGIFADMPFENMQKVLGPKMQGSRILDHVFSDAELDFFVMLSSVNAATGQAGQANYTAANMFMAGLAADRRARGLAASVIDIGMIIGIGIIQRTEGDAGTGVIERNLRRQNLAAISERDLHHMLAEAIAVGRQDGDTEIITGLQHYDSSSPNRPAWYKNPRFSHLVTETGSRQQGVGAPQGAGQPTLASAANEEEAHKILEKALTGYLASELKLPAGDISAETPIIDFGVDSLVAAGIRSWLLSEHKADIPVLMILGGSSVRQVVQEAVAKMSFNGQSGSAKEPQQVAQQPVKELREPAALQPGYEDRGATTPEPTGALTPTSSSSSAIDTPAGSSVAWGELEERHGSRSVVRRGPQSMGQSRLYFSSQYLEQHDPFNCTTAYRLSGPFDVSRLVKALNLIIQRHDIFRTRFYTEPATGRAMQEVVSGPSRFKLKLLQDCDDSADVQAEFRRIDLYPFDLASGLTLIATLLSHGAQSHTLLFGYHHIILDGVSWQLFLQDLGMFYRDASSFEELDASGQCIDFAEKQRQDIDSGRYSERLQYWKGVFPEPPAPLPLFPFAKVASRRALRRYTMCETTVSVDAQLVNSIKRASTASRTTPFHVWLAGFQVLLHRLLDVGDLCVGIVDANRSDAAFSQTIGFLLEIMPVRFSVSGTDTFSEVLKQTRSKTYAALARSGVPIEELARACGVSADKTQTPFAQIIFNYRMGATKASDMGDTRMDFVAYSDARVPFDLAVSVDEKDDGTGLVTLSAQDYLYDQEAVDLLLATYKMLLAKLSTDTLCTVGQAPIHEPALVHRGIALGAGEPVEVTALTSADTLAKRFDAWVARDPDAVAVKDAQGRSLTYKQASYRADQITLALLAREPHGVGSRVSVLCEPTVETAAIILAILRIGAAYVPLDVYATDQRLHDILDESGATVLLCHGATAGRASTMAREHGLQLIDLAETTGTIAGPGLTGDVSRAQDTAFILYTSGSTGKPKGIALTHANICTIISASTQRLSLGREVILQQTGQGFDAALWEMFAALANGGTAVVCDNHTDPAETAALVERERVTVALLIVSEAHALLQYGRHSLRKCSALRVLICGGESFSPSLIDKIAGLSLPALRVFNGYGPTEASIFSAMGDVPLVEAANRPSDYRVPVGGALPGYAMYIVDDEQRPVPVGWVGEVAICGPGVVQGGYLGRPELTAAKWKAAGFLARHEAAQQKGLDQLCYLTGDRGRMLSNGSIIIMGRIDGDSQIKLRGFRVELDEVAECMVQTSDGALADARVVVRSRTAEHQFLVAFVVFAQSSPIVDKAGYLHALVSSLPLATHMRPAMAVPLNVLPFTERGKLDTKMLQEMELPDEASGDGGDDDDEDDMTGCEAALKGMWKDVIQGAGGMPLRIQRDSDFFSVGGTSLLLLRLRAEMRQAFGVDISLQELFQNSTIQSLAARVEGSLAATHEQQTDWDTETQPVRIPDRLSGAPFRSRRPADAPGGLSVLLTGATGFLGSALLKQLVANPGVRRVHCMAVRNPSRVALTSAKIVVHGGDLAQPLLGLADEAAAARVFGDIDVAVHNGAEVSHMKSYYSLRAPNVGATCELARLVLEHCDASRGIPPLHFVSTAGVAALTGWDSLPEAQLPAHAVPPTDGSHGYISSKWASERLLERLSEAVPGLSIVVHRPSNITGDEVGRQDIVHSVLRFSSVMDAVPDLGPGFGTFDLVGVDSAARGIVDDVMAAASSGSVRYRHQSGETLVPAEQLDAFLGHSPERPFRTLPMEDWIAAAREAGMDELVAGFLSASGPEMRMPLLERGPRA